MPDLALQIAASGINAEEAQLDTAANNLANVGTPGYAREVVNQADIGALGANGVGDGVLINSVTEDGSSLYDQLTWTAQSQLGAANQTVAVQTLAQNAFPLTSGTDLSTQLSTLWTDLSTLATEPSNPAAASAVVDNAAAVASTLNSTSAQLSTTAVQLAADLGTGPAGTSTGTGYVGQANQLISQIAQLNGQIAGLSGGAGGSNSPGGASLNALVDQQRAAVNTLSGLLGVRATTQPNGTMNVDVNGIQLVSGTVAHELTTTGSAGAADMAVSTTDGTAVNAGGTIGAELTGINTTIPSYEASLDSIADSLATGLNSLQASGVSAAGVPGANAASAAPPYSGPVLPSIFVNGGSSTTYTVGAGSAATITINPALAADPSQLATAGGTSPAGTATIDPTTAQAMAALGKSPNGPDAGYQSLVARVGSQTQQAQNAQGSAQALANAATTQQSSVEGVNTNEETVNMLAAQQNYQALASVISTATTALEALLQAVQ